LDGLEGHGNASRRSISSRVSRTLKLTADACRNKSSYRNHGITPTVKVQIGGANVNSIASSLSPD
jgi:hypothetical protein